MSRAVTTGGVFLLLSLLLVAAFNQPGSPEALLRLANWRVPLEPVLAAALVVLLPGRVWSLAAACLLGLMLWLRLGDRLILEWMGRPFNALFDIPLGLSLIEIGMASLGAPLTLALAAGAFVLLPLAVFLVWAWLVRLAAAPRRVVIGIAVLVMTMAGLERLAAMPDLTTAHGFNQLQAQVARSREVLEARAVWRAAYANDPARTIAPDQLLTGLAGRDVQLIWIESYGRSALTREPFKAPLTARLDAFEATLEEAGLHAVSGWLTSPTIGGQSWLAHATLTSGVWTADQSAHRQYLQDASADLAHLFARRGHHTVLGMPAIVHPFPEIVRLGFDEWYFADDFGYRGPQLEWVTIPDQYTLWALEQAERRLPIGERAPLFLQVALISSHAPFTPDIPVVEPWERLGDGSIVHDLPKDGGAPRDVWRDHERLLAAYTRSIDYTLATLQSYNSRFGGPETLTIMIGDHEPAARISGTRTERAAPIHIVSGDPALLEPFADWGFTPGMRPRVESAEHAMSAFRRHFLESFSGPPQPGS